MEKQDFFKNRTNLLLCLLIVATLIAGMVRNSFNSVDPRANYINQVKALSEQSISISGKVNELIDHESYYAEGNEWEDLDNKTGNLQTELEKYKDTDDWNVVYLPFSAYLNSLKETTSAASKLAEKEKLDDTDENSFNSLVEDINKSNENLKSLREALNTTVSQDELRVSLSEIDKPALPNEIVVAKEKKVKAEQERIAAEQKAEQERIAAAQKAEQERIAAEQKAEQERIAAEQKAEQERIAAEQKAEQEREEQERLASQQDNNVAESSSGSNMANGSFILNTNTGKLHHDYCNDVNKMKESNKQYIEGPIDLDDYNLCKHCF